MSDKSRGGDFRLGFIDESSYKKTCATKRMGTIYSNSLSSIKSRAKEAKNREATKRKVERSETKKLKSLSRKSKKLQPGVDWSTVDKLGKPVVSFVPSSAERYTMVEILKRPPRSPERKQLVRKLGTEFSRVYTRYRKEVQRSSGRVGFFDESMLGERERKYAEQAAIWCVIKGVTPGQVLKYWHANIKHFSNSRLAFPPLSMLSSAGSIDSVACSVMDVKNGRGAESGAKKPAAGNSFSDGERIDVRLRTRLEEAGFDTSAFNDRYLVNIQINALAIAAGRPVYIAKGVARDMAKWAAVNLYAE